MMKMSKNKKGKVSRVTVKKNKRTLREKVQSGRLHNVQRSGEYDFWASDGESGGLLSDLGTDHYDTSTMHEEDHDMDALSVGRDVGALPIPDDADEVEAAFSEGDEEERLGLTPGRFDIRTVGWDGSLNALLVDWPSADGFPPAYMLTLEAFAAAHPTVDAESEYLEYVHTLRVEAETRASMVARIEELQGEVAAVKAEAKAAASRASRKPVGATPSLGTTPSASPMTPMAVSVPSPGTIMSPFVGPATHLSIAKKQYLSQCTWSAVNAFREYLQAEAIFDVTERNKLIRGQVKAALHFRMWASYKGVKDSSGKRVLSDPKDFSWLAWPNEKFFRYVLKVLEFQDAETASGSLDVLGSGSLEDRLRIVHPGVLSNDLLTPFSSYVSKVWEVFDHLGVDIWSRQGAAVDVLMKGLVLRSHFPNGTVPHGNQRYKLLLEERIKKSGHFESVADFLMALEEQYRVENASYLRYVRFRPSGTAKPTTVSAQSGGLNRRGDSNKLHDKKRKRDSSEDRKDGTMAASTTKRVVLDGCHGCGNSGHRRADCFLKGHPDFSENQPFWNSDAVLALKAAQPDLKDADIALSKDKRLDGKALTAAERRAVEKAYKAQKQAREETTKRASSRKGKPEIVSVVHDTLCTSYETVRCRISLTDNTDSLSVCCLLDTGALKANYCNERVARWLRDQQAASGTGVRHSCDLPPEEEKQVEIVDLATNGASCTTLGKVGCLLKIRNEVSGHEETLGCISCNILPMVFDMIIGLPTIRRYSLAIKLPSFFLGATGLSTNSVPVLSDGSPATLNSEQCGSCVGCTPTQVFGLCDSCAARNTYKPKGGRVHELSPFARSQVCLIAALKDKEEFLDYEQDEDEYLTHEFAKSPYEGDFLSGSSQSSVEEMLAKVRIEGPPTLQAKLRKLVRQYADIFSETVRAEPADLPPMELVVDQTKWDDVRNRGPPRVQTKDKEAEIRKQVQKLLAANVIEVSTAAQYSQVHLVPKPNNEWRFCIDYVRLNAASQRPEGWPIPNISHMLKRIGNQKAKYYGVLDLTSGYHQAPLSKSARAFTAFATFMGVYQWLRVPMGLKGAPAYFQRVMATVVLAGLIYVCCEGYLDDILVYGKSEDEFVSHLRQIFERFRKRRLTIKPSKARLGLQQIEYVGHVINEQGITFSNEKRTRVLNFPKPTLMKHMKAFLGLVNYFRDHVRDYANRVHPLHQMVLSYHKRKKLEWTPVLEQLFEELQTEVANCPALYFVDERAPIHVLTDASGYGIGAYIYQEIDGVERPIVFVSRAFSEVQSRWSTIEKEAYAIFYTLTRNEHLLRDNSFILHTDHKNLTYLNL
jgi:hypothetical protein